MNKIQEVIDELDWAVEGLPENKNERIHKARNMLIELLKSEPEPTELTKVPRQQIAAARHNCNEGWPFPDAAIVLDGYEKACDIIDSLKAENEKLREEIKAKYKFIKTKDRIIDGLNKSLEDIGGQF